MCINQLYRSSFRLVVAVSVSILGAINHRRRINLSEGASLIRGQLWGGGAGETIGVSSRGIQGVVKCQEYEVGSAAGSMWGGEVKNRSLGETGVESTELDPMVLIERGSVVTAAGCSEC